MATVTLTGKTYDAKEEIKSVGGRFAGGEWTVTEEQYAELVEMAAASAARSNKRDRAFSVAWAKITVKGA